MGLENKTLTLYQRWADVVRHKDAAAAARYYGGCVCVCETSAWLVGEQLCRQVGNRYAGPKIED